MRKLVLKDHHLDKYKDIFALSEADLKSKILEFDGDIDVADATLPFKHHEFDLALCLHYVFDNHDVDDHLKIIKELARVAKEVRIFPLSDHHGQPSSLLGPVLLGLHNGYGVEVREVPCNLQTEGKAMLRVWAQQCHLS